MRCTFSRRLSENRRVVSDAQLLETSISAMLLRCATRHPEAPAIIAKDRYALSYARLYRQIEGVATWVNEAGISSHDRVAIVLPNGPEMAVASVAVSACAASAPLNPAYRSEEFDFYLSELRAKALLVQRGSKSDAVAVARSLGIPLIQLSSVMDEEAGVFTLN